MDVLVDALRWAGIVGFAGWMVLNVIVGYQLLKEKPRLSHRRSASR